MIMTRAAVPRRHRGPGCPRSIATDRAGGMLVIPATAWRALLAGIRA
jgi:hypothetical protein